MTRGDPLPNNTAPIYFYIDDMTTPVYVQNSSTTYGFNDVQINTGTGPTLGDFGDVSFALAVPPNVSATRSGNNLVLTWSGSGWTQQSAPSVSGPWTEVAGASSPYSNDTTSARQQIVPPTELKWRKSAPENSSRWCPRTLRCRSR